jgi:flagellar protein FliO/FliZ
MSPLASYIVETFVTLVAVVAIAVAVLYGARRLGVGRPAGPLELVGRLPLDARRTIYLVRVADQVLVVGASEGGLTKLGEVPPSAVAALGAPPATPSFASVLARLRGREQAPERESAAAAPAKEQRDA